MFMLIELLFHKTGKKKETHCSPQHQTISVRQQVPGTGIAVIQPIVTDALAFELPASIFLNDLFCVCRVKHDPHFYLKASWTSEVRTMSIVFLWI